MSASAEYTQYVLELLESIGSASSIHTTRFFGGVGIVSGAVQFAMVMKNTLYFVVDDTTRGKYEKLGMAPFSYVTKKGCVQVRRYYELPEEVLTDIEQLSVWARESMDVASQKKTVRTVKPFSHSTRAKND